jgi:hypothetical protein
LKPSMKSSISASISASRTALAAWSMSIIMARWKCATAPATAFRRWNVSRRRAVAEAQPQCRAWLIVGAPRGVRSGTLGRLAKAATIGPSPCSARLTQWRRGALGSLHDYAQRGRSTPMRSAAGCPVKGRGVIWPIDHWLRFSTSQRAGCGVAVAGGRSGRSSRSNGGGRARNPGRH